MRVVSLEVGNLVVTTSRLSDFGFECFVGLISRYLD